MVDYQFFTIQLANLFIIKIWQSFYLTEVDNKSYLY